MRSVRHPAHARLALVLTSVLACSLAVTASSPAHAQVSEAERAAARELFKEGDELQRASKFADALDKFDRAQQAYSAPTNLLRIAECKAALGRLVEAAETFRAVMRTTLPPGSPPAFQAAVDQAHAELAQVEPRIPKVVVLMQPADVKSPQMQIDGTIVPGALIGTPVPLDPGAHKLLVFARGYVSSEQSIMLRDHDDKTITFALRPLSGVTYTNGPAAAGAASATPPPPSTPPPSSTLSPLPVPPPVPPAGQTDAAAPPPPPSELPPPPPPVEGSPAGPAPKRARASLLLGAHLGFDIPAGSLPGSGVNGDTGTFSMDSTETSTTAAYALDAGLRFARQWYLGLSIEHARFGGDAQLGTTSAAAILGLILNPERTSLYGEFGLGYRWFDYTTQAGIARDDHSGELLLGVGLWMPVSKALRLVPKATLALTALDVNGSGGGGRGNDSTTETTTQGFVMLGIAGYYDIDL